MHRLPSQSAVIRFRLSAYLLVIGTLLGYASLGFMAYSFFIGHRTHMILGACLLGAAILIIVFQWIVAARARCPLCLTPSLSKKSCSKNRNAKRLLGSYRLRASASIIFHNNFRCPYCNEPTVLEVRQRKIH
jgi:hypothetical protein